MTVDISAFASPGLTWDTPSDARSIAAAAAKQTGLPYYYGDNIAQPQYTLNNQPVSQGAWTAAQNTDIQSIIDSLTEPSVSMNRLNYTPPSSGDLQAKWAEFLDRANKDPDIVNYYQKLLDQAKGDTTLAISFLDRDYQMGVRQTTDTLKATMDALGLQFGQEQDTLANTLNQRGIALTQDPASPGNTVYAGGGRAATELGQLNQSQTLRKEAEQRSASQGIERMGLGREKGVTSAKQQLQSFGTDVAYRKGQDIENRAQSYMGLYNQGEQNKLLQAQINQGQPSGGSGPFGGYNTKDEWFKAKTGGEIAPVGWNG